MLMPSMLDGLLYICVGAFFVLAVGRIAYLRGRGETGWPGGHLSPLTRLLMLVAFGGFGITLIAAAATRTWPIPVPQDEWPGLMLVAVGVLLIAVGGRVIVGAFAGARKRTWAVDTDHLATTGIYRWTRNPRALGWFLVYAGLSLAVGSAAALVLSFIFLLGYLPWILLEEVTLERHFGDEYRAYRRRTHRFI